MYMDNRMCCIVDIYIQINLKIIQNKYIDMIVILIIIISKKQKM